MGDSPEKHVVGKGDEGAHLAAPSSKITSSGSNNSLSSMSSARGGEGTHLSNHEFYGYQSSHSQEMFKVGVRLELPERGVIQEFAKFSMGEINCFALALQK